MPFAYRPLGKHQIRLLKPRGLSFDALGYDLIHVDITTKIEYSALSYTWGAPGDSHVIQLDGEWFPVRENLYDALQAIDFRRRNKATASMVKSYIWIDAICINQGKDEEALAERSLQITMMTRIYEQASTILVWLGNPQNEMHNRSAFRKMKEFNQRRLVIMAKNRPYRPWWWPHKAKLPDNDNNTFLASMAATDRTVFDVEGSDTHNAWLGICAIFRSQWWTRTWIFQEATVPEKLVQQHIAGTQWRNFESKVKFLCGKETASWTELQGTVMVAKHIQDTHQRGTEFIQGAHTAANSLLVFRVSRVQNRLLSFPEILELFRPTECFDPRDKIYAPLCLAAENVRLVIKPDYSSTNTVHYVYLDVVRFGISQAGKSLVFLGHACWTPHLSRPFPADWRLTEIPSWVPNWHEPIDFYPIPKVLYIENKISARAFAPYDRRNTQAMSNKQQQVRTFNATGDSACSAQIYESQLHIKGIFCGTIKDVMPAIRLYALGTFAEKSRRWESGSKGRYPTGEAFSQALNKTQVMDLKENWRGRPCERGGDIDTKLLSKLSTDLDAASIGAQSRMKSAFLRATRGRNVCLLEDAYLGMVPVLAEIGDRIFAFLGGQVLYTLRPDSSRPGHYLYIGETYIHGLMDGEVMRRVEVGQARVEELVLV